MSAAQDESEYSTRRKRIDPMLKGQGWKIVSFDAAKPLTDYTSHALTEYATDNGPADYALVMAGELLGIAEAKKVSLGPQNVLVQSGRPDGYNGNQELSVKFFRGERRWRSNN